METLWKIVLRKRACGDYEVTIEGGGNARSTGRHPDSAQLAYQGATAKLLVKPAFMDV